MTLTALNPIHPRVTVSGGVSAAVAALDQVDTSDPIHALPSLLVRPVVVAPTHNNAGTLMDVLYRLDALGLAVIVVNDGSTDSTSELLKDWAQTSSDHQLVTLGHNQGKAAGLRAGFAHALRGGFTHAVSIDTDGQLWPEDIPRLLEKSLMHEAALVLGTRDRRAADYPFRSGVGRWISNLLVRFETGRSVTDSQCGLRVYPLRFVQSVRCGSGHFGFETEIITRSLWADIPVVEVPVQCRYFALQQRVSHFKPFVDSFRAVGMHLRLIATAMNPVHRIHIEPGSRPKHSLIRQFLHWLNPITAWRQIRHIEGARPRFAAGFAIGVFLANTPAYGMQTLIGLYVARRFRLHPVSVVAGVNISVPPISPLLIALAIAVGHWMLHGSWPTLATYHPGPGGWHAMVLPMIVEWIFGSIIVGSVLGAMSFFVLDGLLRLIPDPKPIDVEVQR